MGSIVPSVKILFVFCLSGGGLKIFEATLAGPLCLGVSLTGLLQEALWFLVLKMQR